MTCAADDTWTTKVIKLLLSEYGGRAKFDKIKVSLYQKGLMTGGSLKNKFQSCSGIFIFEKDNKVKHVSVGWRETKICSKIREPGSETCIIENCSKFHVCKPFIRDDCLKDTSCPFGHELQNDTNKKVSETLGLSSFSSEEIRIMLFRSIPAVCEKYNTGDCDDDDCPDLHVCSRFMQRKCTAGKGCKFDHSFQTSEHNKWVLDTFQVRCLTDVELVKLILMKNDFEGAPIADAESQSKTTSSAPSISLLSGSQSTPEEQTEEQVFEVFRFLLKRFGGRAKFNTFLFKRDHLFQGFQREEIIDWLKEHTDRFVLYEGGGDLNYVASYNRHARLCFGYNKPGTFICDDQSCKSFHICRDFVTGACVNNGKCGLSHSLSSDYNRQVCLGLGLPQLTDNELCLVILCSSPTVCVNYNTASCHLEYCPELHVCSKNILNKCTNGDGCKFGHVISNSGEHNSCVLKAFQMDTWQEDVLLRMVIVKKGGHRKISGEVGISPVQAAPPVSHPESKTVSRVERKSTRCHRQLLRILSVKKEPAEVHPSLTPQYDKADTKTEEAEPKDLDFTKYEYICETYTWTGACPKAPDCPGYHSPHRLPYLWMIKDGRWLKLNTKRCRRLEKLFCTLNDVDDEEEENITISDANPKGPVDFCAMEFKIKGKTAKFRRLSTPSYVDAAPGTPLNFYTQWVWYRRERDGTYTPFIPGSLQYTLEEKYLKGQHTYFFEFEDLRLMVDTHSPHMTQTNLDTLGVTRVVRRPVFVSSKKQDAPKMSPLLLDEVPPPVLYQVPKHWSSVDRYQEFELFELTSGDPEEADVQRQFFSTMDINDYEIVYIFRVQNPGLWDKYCSARRAMTPLGQSPEEVEERQLFHGTPTLQAARGICANSFDFRRSGEYVGAIHGKGAYFSTTARYSHDYTGPEGTPIRFMFLGRILVGKYTLGDPSYTKPPERDRLKMYDSCVNDLSDPTIFVIFDLAQSYPEYVIQYTDVSDSKSPPSSPASPVVTSQNQSSPSSSTSSSDTNLAALSSDISPTPLSSDLNQTPLTESDDSYCCHSSLDDSYNTDPFSDEESGVSKVMKKAKKKLKKSCVIC